MHTQSASSLTSIQKFFDNFHTVERNKLYRSAQLSVHSLEKYIKRNNIKTIINLRGVERDSPWWIKERFFALTHYINFLNVTLAAQKFSPKNALLKLLYIYDHAPRPILIHCYSGADRTGEASALWVLTQQKKDIKTALKQLSLRFGYLYFRHPAKYKFISLWQGQKWLIKKYNPDELNKKYKFT